MRKWLVVALIGGWALGVGCGLGAAQLSGYEYYVPNLNYVPGSPGRELSFRDMVNLNGWEPVPMGNSIVLRRPRLRLWR